MTVSPNQIRADFSAAMSEMYRKEVPAYGTLVEIVETVNADVLDRDDNALALTRAKIRTGSARNATVRSGWAPRKSLP